MVPQIRFLDPHAQTLHQRFDQEVAMLEEQTNPSLLPAIGAAKPTALDRSGGSGTSGRLAAEAKIGFVGLGHMGTAMARNLAAAGGRVIAYIRRPDQMEKLVALGLQPTSDFSDLFDCEIVISMLPDDKAVREVVVGSAVHGTGGLASGLRRGAIHLSMSTISTAAASELASEHARRGQGYVAAPVFGNPEATSRTPSRSPGTSPAQSGCRCCAPPGTTSASSPLAGCTGTSCCPGGRYPPCTAGCQPPGSTARRRHRDRGEARSCPP